MLTVTQAVSHIAYVTGCPEARVTQFARELIDQGVFPKSSGRRIARIHPHEAMWLLPCVAFADRRVDAYEVAKTVMRLPYRGGSDGESFIFEDTLKDLLEPFEGDGSEGDRPQHSLRMYSNVNGSFAAEVVVHCKGGPDFLEFWSQPSWGGLARRSYEVSREGVTILRNILNRDDDVRFSPLG
ncbi:hypothetical protein ACQ5SO_07500 [Rhodovulum sp. DZ06]|uniref:hypothetical protein n=1 Tax=Rhodovulum sp. DZ06 TaxID=3425126 RepID=UPI003D32BD7D